MTIINDPFNALANAIMKAETKAKRRVTLSICGLGMLDETELETIKDYSEEIVPQIVPSVDTPIEVANAMARTGSDGKTYGSCTSSQLGFKQKAIEKKMTGELSQVEQDEL